MTKRKQLVNKLEQFKTANQPIIMRWFVCEYKNCPRRSPMIQVSVKVFKEIPLELNNYFIGVKYTCEEHKH